MCEYKVCTKCHMWKTIESYSVNGNRRRSECGPCEYARASLRKKLAREQSRQAQEFAKARPAMPNQPCPIAAAFNRWGGSLQTIAVW